jgi:hypothetical protein
MRHEVVDLPLGWAGTDMTVEWIERLVNDSLTDPIVVLTARDIVRGVQERDKIGESRAISAFVRSKLHYVNEGIETITAPADTLREIKKHGQFLGDCDDAVALWAALHRALGHPVRYAVVSQRRDGLATHIYAEVFVGGRWTSDDTIVKYKPMGWKVPDRETSVRRHYPSGAGGLMRDYLQVGNAAAWDTAQPLRKQYAGEFGPKASVERLADFLPGRDYFGVPNNMPIFRVKNGGMIHQNENGSQSGVGFIPGLIAAATSLAPMLKKFKGKKAPKGVVAPTYTPPPPSPAKKDNTLLYAGGAAAALLIALVVLKK